MNRRVPVPSVANTRAARLAAQGHDQQLPMPGLTRSLTAFHGADGHKYRGAPNPASSNSPALRRAESGHGRRADLVFEKLATLGYAAVGFFPTTGQVVGGHVNADGNRVSTPAEAAGIQDITPENAVRLGSAVSNLINLNENAVVVAHQFLVEGIRPTDVESMNHEQYAQPFWDSLSRTDSGRSLQAEIAREAYVQLAGSGVGEPGAEGNGEIEL